MSQSVRENASGSIPKSIPPARRALSLFRWRRRVVNLLGLRRLLAASRSTKSEVQGSKDARLHSFAHRPRQLPLSAFPVRCPVFEVSLMRPPSRQDPHPQKPPNLALSTRSRVGSNSSCLRDWSLVKVHCPVWIVFFSGIPHPHLLGDPRRALEPPGRFCPWSVFIRSSAAEILVPFAPVRGYSGARQL